MNLKYTPCFYHPDRVAVSVCGRCRRPICLEDKRNLSQNFGFSYSRKKSFYSNQDYCIQCYTTQLKNINLFNPLKIIIPFFLLFFIMIFAIFMLIGLQGSFIYGFLGLFFGFSFFIIIFVFLFFNMIAKFQRQKFLNESYSQSFSGMNLESNYQINNEIHYDSEYPTKKDLLREQQNIPITCFECGTYLSLDDQYCPNCGDRTKEELANYYKLKKI